MADQIAQAQEFIKQAESKKSKGFMSGFFGGGSGSYEQSADLYTKAANCYKIAQKFDSAGDVFIKIAKLYEGANVNHEAISNYQSAAICYLNVDLGKAVNCYEMALAIQIQQGKFTQAAKTHGDIGELLESHNGDMQKAAEHYGNAARFYDQENQKSSAYKFQQKHAASLASAGKYLEAAKMYEKCGNYSANQNLLKYSAKDHFFYACLCFLMVDMHEATMKHKDYLESFNTYQGTREATLISSVIDAIENEQLPEFQKALTSYDNVSKLSPLCTDLLLRIKKNKFTEEDEIC